MVSFTPCMVARNSPWWREASARAPSTPATADAESCFASVTSALTASEQVLRLSLSVLKSPWYSAVMCGGISPREIWATVAAATFRGATSASIMALIFSRSLPL